MLDEQVLATDLETIDAKFRDDMKRFLRTGEASGPFRNYLDNDEQAQAVVEKAFAADIKAFEDLAQLLREGDDDLVAAGPDAASNLIVRGVEAAMHLPVDEQEEFVQTTIAKLEQAAPRRHKRLFTRMLDEFSEGLRDVANAIGKPETPSSKQH